MTAIAYVALAVLLSTLRSATWRYSPRLSVSDSLNGVLSASQFRERVSLELAGARYNALPLASAYLELELAGLRLVAEREGPAAAIATLAALGRCMRRCLRRADIAGRLGAERFLVLLPETSAAEGTAVLARLHREFAAANSSGAGGIDLRVVLLTYDASPAAFDDLVRDITVVVSAARSSGESGRRSVSRP